MHEASLAVPLLRLVLEEAAKHRHDGTTLKVTNIRVRAGLLMGIEAHTLQGIFTLLAEGTEAEGAHLAIEVEPMNGSCDGCNASFTVVKRIFHCPECGSQDVSWKGGNELYIASISVSGTR